MVSCIADYYVSRVTRNLVTGEISLQHVVGPDEFGIGFLYTGVTNNDYTNAVVKTALKFAAK